MRHDTSLCEGRPTWETVRDQVVRIYMILLPSLLIFTNFGERTYQDVIFVSLLLFFFLRREYLSSKLIWTLWAVWLFYAFWSLLTDYLGSGSYDGGWFIRGELMLVFPVFLCWARRTPYLDWLFSGFRLALIIGLPLSVWQVFFQGMNRAHGAENALVFAACISIYGLFVIHETMVRHQRCAAGWVAATLVIVVLSGSTGVVISTLCGLLCLLFLVPPRQSIISLVLPCLVLGLVSLGLSQGLLNRTMQVYMGKGVFTEIGVGQVVQDFINKDFAGRAEKWKTRRKAPPLRKEYRNSIGYRLVYLRGGWEIVRRHPFIGVGSQDDTRQVGRVLGLGDRLGKYSHVHNAFLQDLVAGGVVKLLSLLIVVFFPVVAFYKMGCKKEFSLILVLSVNYIIFGLTNMLFQLTTLNIINTLLLVYLVLQINGGTVRRFSRST